MQRFEIFYSDGSMRSGRSVGGWNSAPKQHVQAVIFLHDDYSAREKVYGFDEYALIDGVIIGADRALPDSKKGELLPNDEYAAIIASLESRSKIWHTTVRKPGA